MQAPSAPGSLEVPLNNNILGQSNADDVSSDGGSSDGGEQQVGEVNQEFNGIDSSSNGPARKRARGRTKQPRKGNLQGRFSGRLETKMDEKRLLDECRLLGPLLGGVGKRGEKSRLTLAKIVRGIASGEIRQHCEQRERELQSLRAVVDGGDMSSQLNELLAENAHLRERLARRDVETDNLAVQVQQANAAAIVAQQEATAVVVAAQQEANAVVAAAQQEANAVVAAAQQEANAVVVAAQQAANAQVAAAAAVAAAPPPPPMLQTSMAPLATVSVVPPGGMATANGITVPSSLPLAVATSGALNIAPGGAAMVPPTPAATIKQDMVVGNAAAVPVPVQAAPMMQQGGTSIMAATSGAVQLVTGSAAGMPEAGAPQQVLLPQVVSAASQPQIVSMQAQQGMVHSNSALQLAPTATHAAPQPSSLQTVTYASNNLPQQTTTVLENVINKQQLQIQASNLGQEAQAQRVQAQQHAAAQQEAHAAAQHAAVQAQQHAKLHAEATMQADSIKRVIQDVEDPNRAACTVQELEAKAAAHADAINQLGVHAQQLSERAQAHAHAQVQANSAAASLSVQAHNLQAVAHQMDNTAPAAPTTAYVVSQAAFTQPVLISEQAQQQLPMESGSFTMPTTASGQRMTTTAAAAMIEQSMASSSSMPRMDPSPVADQQSVLLLQQSGGTAQTIPATVTVVPLQQQQQQQLPHSGALTVDAVQQQQQQMAAMQQVMASGVRSATIAVAQQSTAGAQMLQQVVAAAPQQVVNVVPAQVGLQTVMTADGLPAGQLQTVPVNLQTVSASGVVTTQQVHLISQGAVNTPPDLAVAAAAAPTQAQATVVVQTPPDVAQLSHSGSRQLQHSSSVASQNQIAMKQAAIQQVQAAAAAVAQSAASAHPMQPPPQLTEHQLVVQQLNDSTMPLPPGATPDVLSVLDVSDLMQDADVGTPMPTMSMPFSAPMTSLGLSGPL